MYQNYTRGCNTIMLPAKPEKELEDYMVQGFVLNPFPV